MKVILAVVTVVVGLVKGEAPYPASGWKPSGALLVLPRPRPLNLQYRPAQTKPTTAEKVTSITVDRAIDFMIKEKLDGIERLKQAEGSESGVYHVLLPDGRLQKIEYATAPLREEQDRAQRQESQYSWAQSSKQQRRVQEGSGRGAVVMEPNTVVAQFSRLQGQLLTMTPMSPYTASIQYSDVPPVQPPVYAYNNKASLQRIIRK